MKEIAGQDICVLGGTGSIGTALIARLLELEPKRIRCVSNDEYSMWRAEKMFGPPSSGSPMRYVLKDIRDRHSMREVLRGVDILFMLAAYKHVQYVEYSPREGIMVNVIGNLTVIEEVLANDRVQKVINVSTDKVCYADTTYGITKRLAEKLVEWASFYRPVGEQTTRFANTRFGNVIGSRGSVIERWFDPRVQTIELRDPSHVRFFMSTSEAIDLLLRCLVRMMGGETFVFKMPCVRMGDMALVASELTGKPVKRIPPIPQEPTNQWLMTAEESIHRIEDDKGFVLHRNYPALPPMEYSTASLKPLERDEIREMLEEWMSDEMRSV